MFSKKKDRIFNWLDGMLKDRRRSFRYAPDAPVSLHALLDGETGVKPVRDVSAGGCCLMHESLRPGDVVWLRLESRTPELPLDLRLKAEVLGRRQNGECHCVFVDLGEGEEEALHRFSLAAQRHEARRRRSLHVAGLRKKT